MFPEFGVVFGASARVSGMEGVVSSEVAKEDKVATLLVAEALVDLLVEAFTCVLAPVTDETSLPSAC